MIPWYLDNVGSVGPIETCWPSSFPIVVVLPIVAGSLVMYFTFCLSADGINLKNPSVIDIQEENTGSLLRARRTKPSSRLRTHLQERFFNLWRVGSNGYWWFDPETRYLSCAASTTPKTFVVQRSAVYSYSESESSSFFVAEQFSIPFVHLELEFQKLIGIRIPKIDWPPIKNQTLSIQKQFNRKCV